VPPGLSPFTVSPRALERLLERPSSWYLDLNLLARYVQDGSGGGRVYHHTAPVPMVAALHAGLGVLEEEGLVEVQQRHAECGKQLQAGLEALGLELLVEPGHRLPQLTTVKVPAGTDEAVVRRRLLSDYGIEIGAGAGQLAGQIWRIGCMGNTARRRNVVTLLAALAEVLGR
jgi:alanine-glyoxylate transaminase/serine-glyoxylate transaminase/serine-pyruvate transaminase